MTPFICVDPGWHTALAFFKNGNSIPWYTKQFDLKLNQQDITNNLKQMINIFALDMSEVPVGTLIIIEGTQLWGTSAKSQSAGVRGDISNLSYLVGGYCAVCFLYNLDFKIVLPNEWKGQMSDSILAARIKRAINQEYRTEHIRSAVGIGLAHLGVL